MVENIKDAARSIVLSYVRAALAFFAAGMAGWIDPSQRGEALWAAGVAAAWAAIPAALRAAEAVIQGAEGSSNPVIRVGYSFARAVIATGAMALVGPIEGAGPAWQAFQIALIPAIARALQEALDNTSPKLRAIEAKLAGEDLDR